MASGSRAGARTAAVAAAVLAVGGGLAALAAVARTDAHRSQHLTSRGGPAATRGVPPQSATVGPSEAPLSAGATLPASATATPSVGRRSSAATSSHGTSPAAGPSAAVATPPSLSRTFVAPLHTSGNRIYDATNNRLYLTNSNGHTAFAVNPGDLSVIWSKVVESTGWNFNRGGAYHGGAGQSSRVTFAETECDIQLQYAVRREGAGVELAAQRRRS